MHVILRMHVGYKIGGIQKSFLGSQDLKRNEENLEIKIDGITSMNLKPKWCEHLVCYDKFVVGF